MTTRWGLVKPEDHIVCIQQIHDSFVIKIVSVDGSGGGIKDIRPESLVDLMQAGTPSLRHHPASCNFLHLLPCGKRHADHRGRVRRTAALCNSRKAELPSSSQLCASERWGGAAHNSSPPPGRRLCRV